MPGHVDRPSEAGTLRQLAVRVFNLERAIKAKPTDPLVGRQFSVLFRFDGLVVVGASAPWPPRWRVQLTELYARTRVASSSGPVTARLYINEGQQTPVSIPVNEFTGVATLSQQMGPADWAHVQVIAAGSGAQGLTVDVRGFVIAAR